ncbi:unnamed protein product [Pocillopora meandrina]|uniref:Uncharacterized protein n=1 Tax=Pocillopora meandrina TaxID=46732 RepID=A0AAU9W6U3_9CNID|nr:unnamed protein product [Pocillopora meandrina]
MRFATVLLVAIMLMVMVELSETRRRGGGGRSGGSRGSRGSRSSRSRSRSGRSSSKPKITKYTPIKATSVRSPVIVKQTKVGSRSSTFKRVVFAYAVYRYAPSNAPVYRQGYPMYRSYVSIPKKRAVRVTFERERLLDDKGDLCLDTSAGSQTVKEGIDDHLVDLRTTVKYKNGETKTLHGVGKTVSLEDIKDQDFEVVSLASYDIIIVPETTCTKVEKTVKGTMVTMYEKNPNGSKRLNINNILLSIVIMLLMFMN